MLELGMLSVAGMPELGVLCKADMLELGVLCVAGMPGDLPPISLEPSLGLILAAG